MRLHGVIRPFILRRLKKDVATQLPGKYFHVEYCTLSKRQALLYEDFMSLSSTKRVLTSGNFMGMMGILMQLRKVCNHPDLFEPRSIVSPFSHEPLQITMPSIAIRDFDDLFIDKVRILLPMGEGFASMETYMGRLQAQRTNFLKVSVSDMHQLTEVPNLDDGVQIWKQRNSSSRWAMVSPTLVQALAAAHSVVTGERVKEKYSRIDLMSGINNRRCSTAPILGKDTRSLLTIQLNPAQVVVAQSQSHRQYFQYTQALRSMVKSFEERSEVAMDLVEKFVIHIPKVQPRLPANLVFSR